MNSNHGSLDAGGLKSELPIVQQVTETRTDDSNRPPSERWCHDALLWWAPTEESPHLPHLPTCLGQSCPFRLSWPAAQNPMCTAEWHNHSLAETPSSPVSHQGVGSQRDCPPILAEYKKQTNMGRVEPRTLNTSEGFTVLLVPQLEHGKSSERAELELNKFS